MVQTRLVMPRELLPSQAFSSHGLHQDFHSNWVPKREGSSDPTWPASWPWRPTIFEIEANILSNNSPSPWTQCPKECQLDSAEAIARPYWSQEPRDQEGPRWRRSKWHWKPKFVWPGGCRVCFQKKDVCCTNLICGDHHCGPEASGLLGIWKQANQVWPCSPAGPRPLGTCDFPFETQHCSCFGNAHQKIQVQGMKQLVAYTILAVEKNSCLQSCKALYGSPCAIAATTSEASHLPAVFQSFMASHHLLIIDMSVHVSWRLSQSICANNLEPWLSPKKWLKRSKPP